MKIPENCIDITGKNKAEILAALFNSSKQQGMGFLHVEGRNPMTKEEAEEILKDQLCFDYLKGRVMKIGLKEDFLDPRLYDHDNGQGAAERAIKGIA